MRNKIKATLTVILAFIMLAQLTSSVDDLISLQANVNQNGNPAASGDVLVTIYDQPTGGILIFNSTTDFNGKLVNGRYDILLGNGSNELSLEYGKAYYIDIEINRNDLDFDGQERQLFMSSVGSIGAEDLNSSISNLFVNITGDTMTGDLSINRNINLTTSGSINVQQDITIKRNFYINNLFNITGSSGELRSLGDLYIGNLLNITASTGTLRTSGNITANYYFGDGRYLTNIQSQGNTTAELRAAVTGAVNSTSFSRINGLIFQTNIGDNVNISNNISSQFYFGNGRYLTNIQSQGNTTAELRAAVTGFVNSTSWNRITGLVYLATNTDNITVNNLFNISSKDGTLRTPGDIYANRFIGDGSLLTGFTFVAHPCNATNNCAVVIQGGGFGSGTGVTLADGWGLFDKGIIIKDNSTYLATAGTINGSQTPMVDNVFDIGNATHRYRNITAARFVGDGSALTDISDTKCATDEVLLGNGSCKSSAVFFDNTDTNTVNTTAELRAAVTNFVNSTSFARAGTNVFLQNIGDNVGIGTASPNEKLTVVGNVNVTNNITSQFYFGNGRYLTGVVTAGNTTSELINAVTGFVNSTSFSRINGLVFQTNLGDNVNISNNISSQFYFGDGRYLTGIIKNTTAELQAAVTGFVNSTSFSRINGLVFNTGQTRDNFTFGNSTTTFLSVASEKGYVGIGTQNPAQTLDVNGDIFIQGNDLFFIGGSGQQRTGLSYNSANENLRFSTNGATYMVLDSGGEFGVGETATNPSPLGKFYVVPSSASQIASVIKGFTSQSADLFQIRSFNSSGTKADFLTVDRLGFMSLGNVTPNEKLTVVGNANLTGFVIADSYYGNGINLTNVNATYIKCGPSEVLLGNTSCKPVSAFFDDTKNTTAELQAAVTGSVNSTSFSRINNLVQLTTSTDNISINKFLNISSKDGAIYSAGNIVTTGSVTANTFSGDGAGLTNVQGKGNTTAELRAAVTGFVNSSAFNRINGLVYSANPGDNINLSGNATATFYFGDGRYLTNIIKNTTAELQAAVTNNVNSSAWAKSSTNVFLQSTSDRVGIGTKTPQGSLQVARDLVTSNSTGVIRKYSTSISNAVTSTEIMKIGELLPTGNSQSTLITGYIYAQTGNSYGQTEFSLSVRSNSLPSTTFKFTQSQIDSGILINLRVFQNTTTGALILGFQPDATVQNYGWDIVLNERGDYDQWVNENIQTNITDTISSTNITEIVQGSNDLTLNPGRNTFVNSSLFVGNQLQVTGNSYLNGTIRGTTFAGDGGGLTNVTGKGNTTAELQAAVTNNVNSTAWKKVDTTVSLQTSSDSIAVGTDTASALAKLFVSGTTMTGLNGTALLRLTPSGTDFFIQASRVDKAGNSTKLRFAQMSATATAVTIDIPNNRLGVGTTDPNEALTVVGNANITGNTNIGSMLNPLPLNVKANTSGYAIRIEEGSGTEHFQLGVDANGGLMFLDDTGTGSITETPPLYIMDGTSRIGIGTTTPSAGSQLHVNGSGATGSIKVSGSGSGYTGGNIILEGHATLRGAGIYNTNTVANTTWFFGNGYANFDDAWIINRRAGYDVAIADVDEVDVVNMLYLTKAGRLGLGNNTAPKSTLDILGNFTIRNETADFFIIQPDFQRVGIGTSRPNEVLTVVGNINTTNNISAQYYFGDGRYLTGIIKNTTAELQAAVTNFVNSSAWARTDRFIFAQNNNDSVGIGNTTTPSYPLHIRKAGEVGVYLEGDSDNSNEADNVFLKLSQDGASVSSIIGHTSATNTNPESGTYTGAIANALLIGTDSNNADLQLGTNSNARLTILTNGLVGIGTNTPQAFLDVNGNTTLSGTIYVNGTVIPSNKLNVIGDTNITGTIYTTNQTIAGNLLVGDNYNEFVNNQYSFINPIYSENFNNGNIPGWTTTSLNTTASGNGTIIITSNDTNPTMSRTVSINGTVNRIIAMRYRILAGSINSQQIYFSTAGHGAVETNTINQSFRNTLINDKNWHISILDTNLQDGGNNDWQNSTITSIRFDFGAGEGDIIELDWIAIGSTDVGFRHLDNDLSVNGTVYGTRFVGDGGSLTNVQGKGNTTAELQAAVTNNVNSTAFSVSGTMILPTTSTNNLSFDSGLFYIDNTNNRIGIGTSTPSETLTVLGNANITNNFSVNGKTLFANSELNRVGIGTTTPIAMLDVDGNATFGKTTVHEKAIFNHIVANRVGSPTGAGVDNDSEAGTIYTDDSNMIFASTQDENAGTAGGFTFQLDNDGTSVPVFLIENRTGEDLFNFAGSGRFGVGDSSPDYAIEVLGTKSNGFLGLTRSADGDVLAVTDKGYIGINGESSPENVLDILGNVTFDSTGFVYNSLNDFVGIGVDPRTEELEIQATTPRVMIRTTSATADNGLIWQTPIVNWTLGIDTSNQNNTLNQSALVLTPSNTLSFTTNDGFTFSPTGSFGIGTGTNLLPETQLHVRETSATTNAITIHGTSANSAADQQLNFWTTALNWSIGVDASNTRALVIVPSNTSALGTNGATIISPSGFLGLGMNAGSLPNRVLTLKAGVSGTTTVTTFDTNDWTTLGNTNGRGFICWFCEANGSTILNTHSTIPALQLAQSSHGVGFQTSTVIGDGSVASFAQALYINGSGHIGIGTDTPAYKLDIRGTGVPSTTPTISADDGILITGRGGQEGGQITLAEVNETDGAKGWNLDAFSNGDFRIHSQGKVVLSIANATNNVLYGATNYGINVTSYGNFSVVRPSDGLAALSVNTHDFRTSAFYYHFNPTVSIPASPSPIEGDMYVDSGGATGALCFYDGSSWIEVGTSVGTCG